MMMPHQKRDQPPDEHGGHEQPTDLVVVAERVQVGRGLGVGVGLGLSSRWIGGRHLDLPRGCVVMFPGRWGIRCRHAHTNDNITFLSSVCPPAGPFWGIHVSL